MDPIQMLLGKLGNIKQRTAGMGGQAGGPPQQPASAEQMPMPRDMNADKMQQSLDQMNAMGQNVQGVMAPVDVAAMTPEESHRIMVTGKGFQPQPFELGGTQDVGGKFAVGPEAMANPEVMKLIQQYLAAQQEGPAFSFPEVDLSTQAPVGMDEMDISSPAPNPHGWTFKKLPPRPPQEDPWETP